MRALLLALCLSLGTLGCESIDEALRDRRVRALEDYHACREIREKCLKACIAGNAGLGRDHARYHCVMKGDSQYRPECGQPCVHPINGPDEP